VIVVVIVTSHSSSASTGSAIVIEPLHQPDEHRHDPLS
jgi:hypothetical protein